jgi:hypothetical protein
MIEIVLNVENRKDGRHPSQPSMMTIQDRLPKNLQPEVSGLHIRVFHQFLGIPLQDRSSVFKDIAMMDDR